LIASTHFAALRINRFGPLRKSLLALALLDGSRFSKYKDFRVFEKCRASGLMALLRFDLEF
jgi:hypothetical protein